MANGFTGKISLEYEGKHYRLTLDFNALADFEGKTGKEPMTVIQKYEDTGKISMLDLRALFWAGLSQDCPDLTLKEAGLIMSANTEALKELLDAMAPEPDPDQPTAAQGTQPAGKRKARKRARAA